MMSRYLLFILLIFISGLGYTKDMQIKGPFDRLQECSYERFIQMNQYHMSKCYQLNNSWFYDIEK